MFGGTEPARAGPATVVGGTRELPFGLALLVAACASTTPGAPGLADPPTSVTPTPNYADVCAPVGADTTTTCLRITLEAVDAARAAEGVRPMLLPADFARLTVPEQLFVAVDRERVDRGLAPFLGLVGSLDTDAQQGAQSARLPPRPSSSFVSTGTEWIGEVDNGLDADFQWTYDDGPDSGVSGCTRRLTAGCWADREIVLGRFPAHLGHLVMGAAFDPRGDTSPGDLGGSSLAAALAVDTARRPGYVYTWRQALTDMSRAPLRPLRAVPASESATGIPDPAHNVAAVPDYTAVCADTGLDDSTPCTEAALAAINHAHALEGVRPMVLPASFTTLTVPQQLFVAVDLERVDRGLPPFLGLTTGLDENSAARRRRCQRSSPIPARRTTWTTRNGPGGPPTRSMRCTAGCTTTASTAATSTASTAAPRVAGGTAKGSSTISARVPTWRWAPLSTRAVTPITAMRAGPLWRSPLPWPPRRRALPPLHLGASGGGAAGRGPLTRSAALPAGAPASPTRVPWRRGAHLGCAIPARTSRGGRV